MYDARLCEVILSVVRTMMTMHSLTHSLTHNLLASLPSSPPGDEDMPQGHAGQETARPR
jgi:hypothetical protein